MGYIEQEPARPLARVVRSVWIQQVGAEPYLQRNLPTGGVELHCRIGSVPRLVGPLTHALTDVLEPGSTLVGVRFQPGAAAPLVGAASLVAVSGCEVITGVPLSAARPRSPRPGRAGRR